MSLLDRQLPEPQFIERDAEKITREAIAHYEELAGKTLYAAQVERLLINVLAYREKLVREGVQDAAKLNLVRYSRGIILDALGENVGVGRVAATHARATLRFTFDPSPALDTVLPQETRVSTDNNVVFATTEPVTVSAGNTAIDVTAACEEAGVIGNGIAIGRVNTLLDTPPSLTVKAVQNLTVSEGGAEEESDERFRERIVLAPESFSVAGPSGAYRFHALTAHPAILEVAAVSLKGGEVTLYPRTAEGLPGEAVKAAVLAACNGEKMRPMCDTVTVDDPVPVDYAIEVELMLKRSADATTAQAEVERAARAFRDERTGFGVPIVRSQLIDALHVYGIYSVNPVEPAADVEPEAWEYPRCTGITIRVTGVSRAG
jgi:phage-related baseplate assembly protein